MESNRREINRTETNRREEIIVTPDNYLELYKLYQVNPYLLRHTTYQNGEIITDDDRIDYLINTLNTYDRVWYPTIASTPPILTRDNIVNYQDPKSVLNIYQLNRQYTDQQLMDMYEISEWSGDRQELLQYIFKDVRSLITGEPIPLNWDYRVKYMTNPDTVNIHRLTTHSQDPSSSVSIGLIHNYRVYGWDELDANLQVSESNWMFSIPDATDGNIDIDDIIGSRDQFSISELTGLIKLVERDLPSSGTIHPNPLVQSIRNKYYRILKLNGQVQ